MQYVTVIGDIRFYCVCVLRFYCNFVSLCRGVCGCVRGCVEGVSRVYHGFMGV